jgi:tricorn protease
VEQHGAIFNLNNTKINNTMKQLCALLAFLVTGHLSQAQISAKLMRHFDVSETQIVFVYGGDLWIVPKTGGQAAQITHSPGEESFPKFSPDGSEIAFTASYDGNQDVYVMPVTGGVPTRVTYASYADRMVEWHPDGRRILIASRRETGIPRVNQFFLVDKKGGLPQRLAVPYGELASFSPDGNKLAYITKITENYPFKRYRGGLTSDVIVFDLLTNKADNITNNHANDGKPAWAGNKIYFLSDQDKLMRLNIWSHDMPSKTSKQVTAFSDFDISYLSAGPRDLVFENGGVLYRMDLSTEKYEAVNVTIVSDLNVEMPRLKNVERNITNMTAAPGGKRVVFEARGELFNVPVKEGYTINLTQSSGAFDQNPAWSPDGNTIAYWSDQSGEYEIYLQDMKQNIPARKLSNRKGGFGYALFWSPDNKKIAFIDEKNVINLIDVTTGVEKAVDNYTWNIGHGGLFGYTISWSPDSKWMAYTKGEDNSHDAIYLHNIQEAKSYRVTSGFYSDSNPVFSPNGKYLFYFTDRQYNAAYSGLGDGTWIYPNNTQLAAISLTKDAPDLLSAKNDEVTAEKKAEPESKPEVKPDNKTKTTNAPEPEKKTEVTVRIDWDDIESRLTILPPKAGNFGNLMAVEGKIVYRRMPITGDQDGKPTLMFYDLEKREEKKIVDNAESVKLAADGKAIVVRSAGKYGIIKPEPDQKIDPAIPTSDLVMQWIPKQEWKQIFNDTWKRHRDFFYDKDMQKVDWNALRIRYGALIEDARTRWDVSFIQSNLNAELSAGHTYTSGGDAEPVTPILTGYLGIDWELSNNKYRIKRMVRPAVWDTEVRSPFDHSGSTVAAGDYILSVNGMALDPAKDPYAAFDGLSGKTVVLSISKTGNAADAKNHLVKCLTQNEEQNLRYLEWIEQNRKMIDKLSDGNLGYVYMSNTGGQGQLELVKMYYGQLAKKGFIIDERFNGGGQLADRFLELLNRPVIYNLYWRYGRHHGFPVKTNTGPMGMLINGWAGSGGDGLPWAFRELQSGPIVGERTVGILVGPATGHTLIDGGGITVPDARLYYNSGKWFDEGVGVSPDFEVWDDPNMLVQGRDPQMEKVVDEVMKKLKTHPPKLTPPPAKEDRTASGLNKN